jgi:tRNA A-37 threonylcarbamoyl transferase component Bud32
MGDAASKTNDLTAAATTDAAADDAAMAFGETEAAPALTASGAPVANAPTVQVIVNGGHKTSEDLAAEADALIGSVLNERFKLLKRIGHGGMGVVYKARHIHLDTLVAIKVLLHAQRKEDQERFVQEARLASKVLHPNTVYISDFGVLPDGRSYLAMELIQGKTLMSEINHGAMDVLRALRITMQIARGLQAVHDKGIIHRDMKPENVFLLDQDGAHDFVKIVDFGIAKATAKVSLVDEASGQLSMEAIEKAAAAEAEALAASRDPASKSAPEQLAALPRRWRVRRWARRRICPQSRSRHCRWMDARISTLWAACSTSY